MNRLKTHKKDGNIKKMISKIKNIIKISSLLPFYLFISSGVTYAASAACENGNAAECLKDPSVSKIMDFLIIIINVLSGLVIVIAVIMLIVAGIMYITSNGDPSKVTAARRMIGNILLGVVAYFFLWAILNWLVPGGVFTK